LQEIQNKARQLSYPSAGKGFDLDLPGPLVAAGFADQARRARDRACMIERMLACWSFMLTLRSSALMCWSPVDIQNPAERVLRLIPEAAFTFSVHKKRKATRSRQRAKPKAERKASTTIDLEPINSRSLADGSG
jgi:hypothetical protein